MTGYFKVMRRYGGMSGRASRSEYWGFYLVFVALLIVAAVLDEVLKTTRTNQGFGVIFASVHTIHIIPQIAALVRRLHDTGRSGWWFWISLTVIGLPVLLVFACLRGTIGPNQYGAEPPEAAQGRPEGLTGPSVGIVAAAPPRDAIAEIERLAQLKASGSLSDAEFEVMKAKALSGQA